MFGKKSDSEMTVETPRPAAPVTEASVKAEEKKGAGLRPRVSGG